LVKLGNKYINDVKPWASTTYDVELSNLVSLIRTVNVLYVPVFGIQRSNEFARVIDAGKKEILFNRI